MGEKNDKELLEKKLKAAFAMCSNFESDYTRILEYNETYAQKMRKLMKEQTVLYHGKPVLIDSRHKFKDITGLSASIYYKILAEDNYIPSLVTFMTLCMIYDLDMFMASTLRETLGLCFNRTKREHLAYCYLLVYCRGKSISFCNTMLKKLGIDKEFYLGDQEIDTHAVEHEIKEM